MDADIFDASRPPGFRRRRGVGLYLGVFAAFLLLYALTTQHGPAWQDSGIFQNRIRRFDLTGQMGLALAHPLLILLGKAFSALPFGGLAWRMNLVSAVCGALAVANVALLVRRLEPRRPAAAWFAAGALGLAHTPWWLSTICESQMVHAAVFTAELHVLLSLLRAPRPGWALLLGVANGLALTAHNLALLALPVYVLTVGVLCVRGRIAWSAPALLAVGWAVGGSGLLALVAREARAEGLGPAVASALFGRRWRADVLGGSGRAVAMGLGYVAYNLPNLVLPLAAAGLVGLWRRQRGAGVALTALGGVALLFAVRYTVADQFMFFGPFYAVAAVLGGLGFAAAERRGGGLPSAALAALLLGPTLYAVMPPVARMASLPVPGRKDLPFRDPARYWLSPWKGREDSAERFARAALAEVPGGATIVADSSSGPPLAWVREVEDVAPSVRVLVHPSPGELPPGTPDVFAVSDRPGYRPDWLAKAARLERPEGALLHRVIWRDAADRAGGTAASPSGAPEK